MDGKSLSLKLSENESNSLEEENIKKVHTYQFYTLVALSCVSVLLIVLFISFQSSLNIFQNSGSILVLAYSIFLVFFLIQIPWDHKSLPYIHPEDVYEPVGQIYIFIFIMLVIYFSGFLLGSNPYIWMLEMTTIITVILVIILRSQISIRLGIVGIATGVVSGIVSMLEQIQISVYYSTSLDLITPIFWAVACGGSIIIGAILLRQISVSKIKFLDQRSEGYYISSLKSLLLGGIFSIPIILLYLLTTSSSTIDSLKWGSQGFEIIYAVNNALIENIIFNLFFITWIFSLLYRRTNTQNAQILTIVFTSIVYQFSYISSWLFTDNTITILLQFIYYLMFYTLPPLLLYWKRNFEFALGYRIAIASIPFIVAFIVFSL